MSTCFPFFEAYGTDRGTLRSGNPRNKQKAIVTQGLKCPPEVDPAVMIATGKLAIKRVLANNN
jgi:hypothetical protein